MINVPIAVAHAFGFRHLPKHGVGSEFSFPATEALKQTAEFLQVGSKVHGWRTPLPLVHFRAGLEAMWPGNWDPKRQGFQDRALEEAGGRTDVFLVQRRP